jgi:hypothetical protein
VGGWIPDRAVEPVAPLDLRREEGAADPAVYLVRAGDGREAARTWAAHPAVRWAWLVAVTAVIGTTGELFFYTLVKVGRTLPVAGPLLFSFDWRVDPALGLDAIWAAPVVGLFGQASLWMAPVYVGASLLVVRPLWLVLQRQPVPLRAAAYAVGITLFEGLVGLAYQRWLGLAIWTYADGGAFWGGATSWRITPLWMLIGMVSEAVVREADHPAWLAALRQRLGQPRRR